MLEFKTHLGAYLILCLFVLAANFAVGDDLKYVPIIAAVVFCWLEAIIWITYLCFII